MKEILDKISSYNLFNYLLPGVLFAVIADTLTGYSFFQEYLIITAFVVYFIGLVISRFGSLILEPILRKLTFLKFVDYPSYVSASNKDPKIELLSEVNNMYRTLSSTLVLIVFLKIWELTELKWSGLKLWSPYILIVLLMIMFFYSYRKQTEYVVKRVNAKK